MQASVDSSGVSESLGLRRRLRGIRTPRLSFKPSRSVLVLCSVLRLPSPRVTRSTLPRDARCPDRYYARSCPVSVCVGKHDDLCQTCGTSRKSPGRTRFPFRPDSPHRFWGMGWGHKGIFKYETVDGKAFCACTYNTP